MNELREAIKRIPGVRKTYYLLRRGRMENGFHGDRIMREYVLRLLKSLAPGSFVETGTYLGDTAEFMAKGNPGLRIFSCECNPSSFAFSKRRLRRFPNVSVYNQSSEKLLSSIIGENLLGPVPLFFLDAHWYDYWPLQDEIATITQALERAVIIIDDFEVPERSDFLYQRGDGNTQPSAQTKSEPEIACNLELIRSKLRRDREYRFLFPSYTTRDSSTASLVGYVTIFQNLNSEFERFVADGWGKKFFRELVIEKGYAERPT